MLQNRISGLPVVDAARQSRRYGDGGRLSAAWRDRHATPAAEMARVSGRTRAACRRIRTRLRPEGRRGDDRRSGDGQRGRFARDGGRADGAPPHQAASRSCATAKWSASSAAPTSCTRWLVSHAIRKRRSAVMQRSATAFWRRSASSVGRRRLMSSSRDGVAELWGTIMDERERHACIVAAENVAGVKEVHDHLVWVEPMSGVAFPSAEDEANCASERRSPAH